MAKRKRKVATSSVSTDNDSDFEADNETLDSIVTITVPGNGRRGKRHEKNVMITPTSKRIVQTSTSREVCAVSPGSPSNSFRNGTSPTATSSQRSESIELYHKNEGFGSYSEYSDNDVMSAFESNYLSPSSTTAPPKKKKKDLKRIRVIRNFFYFIFCN